MGSSVGGVGLMLSKRSYSLLSGIENFNSRILIAHFNGNPATMIVVTYSPTEAATTQEAEDYHNDLRNILESIPVHNFLLVIGDLK